jgi:hypothetical protein
MITPPAYGVWTERGLLRANLTRTTGKKCASGVVDESARAHGIDPDCATWR